MLMYNASVPHRQNMHEVELSGGCVSTKRSSWWTQPWYTWPFTLTIARLPQAALTPFAKQSLNEMQPKYLIEVFQEQELQVNITKHVLVPKHQVRNIAASSSMPSASHKPARSI